MKKRELQEIKNKSLKEIEKQLSDLMKKRLELEVAVASGKQSNLKAVGSTRRDIAQVLTLLRASALEGQAMKKKGEDN